MKSMSIEIETLTPICTGGVKGDCDILHETGIIGSMRWWYEVIVRWLGGDACDPTEHGCIFI
jgi:CRISPR-associated protein Cmr1